MTMKTWQAMEMQQNLWNAAKAMQREVFYNISLPQETRDTYNKQPNLTPRETKTP